MINDKARNSFLVGMFAILPGVLPDALSLAQEWTWITLVIAVVSLIIVSFVGYFKQEEHAATRSELQLTCGILVVTCLALGGYRVVSGATITAKVLPDAAMTIAEFVGTQERLIEMTAQVSAEVNRIGQTTDRTETKVDTLSGKIEEGLAVQEAKNNFVELYMGVFSANAIFPTGNNIHLDLNEVQDPEKWISMTKTEIPAIMSFSFETATYRPRNLDFQVVIADTTGKAIERTGGILMREDDFGFDEGYASVQQDIIVPEGMFDLKEFVVCMTAKDADSGEHFSHSQFIEFDRIREVKVSYGIGGRSLNVLPSRAYLEMKNLSHASLSESEFCGKLAAYNSVN